LVVACAGVEQSTVEQALTGKANVDLKHAFARLALTSFTDWSLDKHGSINPATSTVTWQVTATQGATKTGVLVVYGTFTVKNNGGGGAPIGNIVVDLQTRSGNHWVLKSADVADATQDDAATTAKVVASASAINQSTFTENAASGRLLFMDAATNTAFSLVPQVTIPPHSTKTLLFAATFDNNVLHLPIGSTARAEVIVSFANAGNGNNTASNVDINGNGIVDADEARVKSVAERFLVQVPHLTPINPTVTLTDTLADISTTGTVTFTNAQFNLGATSGTVTAHYDGGTSGGTITNCAHLRSPNHQVSCGSHTFTIPGIDLTACDTQVIGPHVCTPGAPGCGWETGDLVTYAQDAWGEPASIAGGLLIANYDNIYLTPLEVGIAGVAGFSMRFFNALAVLDYLPASSLPGPLTADLIDPTSSSSGQFGGNVVALELDVDMSDAGVLGGTSGLRFGDLLLCEFTTPALNGITVRQFLAIANTLLGGGSGPLTIDDADPITFELTRAFVGGDPSTFAQQHLFAGSCPL
jgi:hypothetical protein